jgi:hypothetical protein
MRRLLVTMVLVGTVVLLPASWLDQVRASTALPSDAGLHAFATTAPSGRMAPYPRIHHVICTPMRGRTFAIALDYFEDGFKEVGTATRSGAFKLGSGVIQIDSEAARFEASLPAGMRPDFDATLRHEYGHAFFYDLLADKTGYQTNAGQAVYRASASHTPSVSLAWPLGLKAVVAEYRRQPPTIYGQPYFTSNFAEYFAESYARFVAGRSVPPATHAFFTRFAR